MEKTGLIRWEVAGLQVKRPDFWNWAMMVFRFQQTWWNWKLVLVVVSTEGHPPGVVAEVAVQLQLVLPGVS